MKKILLFFLILSLVTISISAAKVKFTYEPDGSPEIVYVAGSFNNWNAAGIAMSDNDDDGVWEAELDLPPGTYQYKFVVDGTDWKPDPNNPNQTDDGFGGYNSVIQVQVSEDAAKPSEEGDGGITVSMISHNNKLRKFFNFISENEFVLSLSAKNNDVQKCTVYIEENEYPMYKLYNDRFNQYFQSEIKRVKPFNMPLKYYFSVQDGDKTIYFGENGTDSDKNNIESFTVQNPEPFPTPDWVKKAVFYQIFPDRFSNGREENDFDYIEMYNQDGSFMENHTPKWDQGVPKSKKHLLDYSEYSDDDRSINPAAGWHVLYGGDLQGIINNIDYIRDLGITAIYFNPIFEATSNHKYNTADYGHIDDNFGVKGDFDASDRVFAQMAEKLHQNGIKFILDGVFNHTGYEFWAFQDIVEKGRDSKYKNWYFIKSYPVIKLWEQSASRKPNYDAWWGFGSLPKLNTDNSEVSDYLLNIGTKWLDPNKDGNTNDGCDGWRLDVPNEVPHRFWKKFRKEVKSVNPDAYIVGEIWQDGTPWLKGDQFDAVMNYRFRDACIGFFAKRNISAKSFSDKINAIYSDYPKQVFDVLFNLLGSHDTQRFLREANENRVALQLATAAQLTLPGAPSIYYGDEIGMTGGKDPDCRRTFIWEKDEQDINQLSLVKKLNSLRHEYDCLSVGRFKFIPVSGADKLLVYLREYEDNNILVIINNGNPLENTEITGLEGYKKAKSLLYRFETDISDGKLKLPVASAFSYDLLLLEN